MDDTAAGDIARFLKRLQWALVALAAGWLVWLLGPILTPFVVAALLGWLGDPMVDRLERAGRSRNTAVILVFALMALLLALALLILVPTLQRQVVTLVESLPHYREWFTGTAIPWLEQRTRLQLSTWLDPEYLIEQLRVHWDRAGGIATTALGYLSRSGFAVFAMVANVLLRYAHVRYTQSRLYAGQAPAIVVPAERASGGSIIVPGGGAGDSGDEGEGKA